MNCLKFSIKFLFRLHVFILAPFCCAQTPNYSVPYTWTTIAGYASLGNADGAGPAAQFNRPFGVAVDNLGNAFVTDSGNSTIRKMSTSGLVTTIAGFPGSFGSADGTNSFARFAYPSGIAVGSSNTIYVADFGNHTIRRIQFFGTNSVVTTLAGLSGVRATNDGVGSAARFNGPISIAVDTSTNLFVADILSSVIRKVSPSGTNWIVSTIAGLPGSTGSANGTNSSARFNQPYGLALDASGNIFVADTFNGFANAPLRKITPVGTNWVVSTVSAPDPDICDPDFSVTFAPTAIVLDKANKIYTSDFYRYAVRQNTPTPSNYLTTLIAGTCELGPGSVDGTGPNARFRATFGLATDAQTNIYLADYGNNVLRTITSARVVSTVAGSASSVGSGNGNGSTARFNGAKYLAIDSSGNLYTTDAGNHTIRRISTAGVVSTFAGLAGNFGLADGAGTDARFNAPAGIAVDTTDNVYVADSGNKTIRRISQAGLVTTITGTNAGAQFVSPQGIIIDSSTNIYVVDTGAHVIRKTSRVGAIWQVSIIAGVSGTPGNSNGTNANARFSSPTSIAINTNGILYVVDSGNSTIRKLTPVGANWAVTTIAGSVGITGAADGDGLAFARFGGAATNVFVNIPELQMPFSGPTGITCDSAGSLYITDTGNDTVRKINFSGSTGSVVTIGGLAQNFGSADGLGNSARFNEPVGIIVDKQGVVYLADTGNNTIRKGSFTTYSQANIASYSPPQMTGQLAVTLLPPESNGQWRFPWEFSWRNSGQVASNLTAGNYSVEFRNLPNFIPFLTRITIAVTNGGRTSLTNTYYQLGNPSPTNTGSLTVNIGPNSPAGSGWRFFGEVTWRSPGSTATNLIPDSYFVEFPPVANRIKPSSLSVQILSGSSQTISANYLLANSAPNGVVLPFAIATNNITNLNSFPFGFNGQIQSDNGFGSGVAVSTNVVLTAAHVVFNDQTLSYVKQAHWYWQKGTGAFEPPPLSARGFSLLSGYASQRTNDLQSGLYGADQSTPQSRNLDVAALYFLTPVAGGSSGGYLPSDAVPNPWLSGTSLKMVVGYPVDGSLFGDATIVNGRMYQTDPQPYPLSVASDSAENQQVYTAPWFFSYSGNSGGPLYVQLNGYYYPAAVYLGTLYNGSQPQASAVRAIDSNVVNLITRAATMGDSGTNSTGGGAITVVPGQTAAPFGTGLLTVSLTPNSLNGSFGWRIMGLNTNYFTSALTTVALIGGGNYTIEFKPFPGFVTPTNRTTSVSISNVVNIQADYVVIPVIPILNALRSGSNVVLYWPTTAQNFVLESAVTFNNSNLWSPVSVLKTTIGTNHFVTNQISGTNFYRLKK
jgi:sugar lactone lactonase YvrE